MTGPIVEIKVEPRDLIKLDLVMTQLDAQSLLTGEWMPFMTKIVDVVGEYPPDFPGNTYVRTGHLGESWTKEVLNPLQARIGNDAVYAGYVQGHEQIDLHAGHGWKHLFEEAQKYAEYFVEKIGEKAERLWER